MPSMNRANGGEYWRSLDELAGDAEALRHARGEFPGPDHFAAPTRRDVLKYMGASAALAGMTGCRWPVQEIVPFNQRPPGRAPGAPVYYATTMELGGVGTGLLITCFDGRPVKVEGNTLHPYSLGSTNHLAQAAILDFYDPDRLGEVFRNQGGAARETTTWDKSFVPFARQHFGESKGKGGDGLCILAEASSSPTLADVRQRFMKAFPRARWFEFEPITRDHERLGTAMAFGKPCRPLFKLDKADVIASFGADLLLAHPAAVRYTRDFASRRTADDANKTMNRLYVVESGFSLTGSNADYRLAVRAGDVPTVLRAVAARLKALGANVPAAALDGEGPAKLPAAVASMAERIAADLYAHRGHGIVTVGYEQPAEAHALAHLLNNALDNIGATVAYIDETDPQRPTCADAIRTLTESMSGGQVNTLVILGGNPVYNAPADLDFAKALTRVATSIHLSDLDNETARACSWRLPRAHFLESWGDCLAYDGTYCLIQPQIQPLYAGRTSAELLALLAGEEVTDGYHLVRRTFASRPPGGDADARWRAALADGLVAKDRPAEQKPTIVPTAWSAAIKKLDELAAAAGGDYDVTFAPDYKLYDGRFANNGWLQELPDPMTKITWDNAAILAPASGRALGIERSGDLLRIEIGGASLTIPAYIMPGHAPQSITLPLGYGRGRAAGVVANGQGVDTYRLRTSDGMHIVREAKVSRSGGFRRLYTTQDHHAMKSAVGAAATQERIPILVREGTLDEYRKHPDFVKHVVHALPLVQLFAGQSTEDYPNWAMTIDLTRCTGCSACVTACQAENNIPVVGKDEVGRGREMSWIRIDRYFRGGADAPDVVHQPMTCHHCENAPCEQVCPVAATVHDNEGLNLMVYNRCVGTRYCSNNCPFKVRRFNWFYNHQGPYHPRSLAQGTPPYPGTLPQKKLVEMQMLGMNPEVTVRSRGVMEKCTFCVQRIAAAKIKYRNLSVREHQGLPPGEVHIPDGAITPACAQACPAEAIVFGDKRRADHRVSKMFASERGYTLLDELNLRPRLKYLARLRNREGGAHGGGAGHGEKQATHHAG